MCFKLKFFIMDRITARVTQNKPEHIQQTNPIFEDPLGLNVPEPEYLESEQNQRLFEVTMYKTGVSYAMAAGFGATFGFIQGLLFGEKGSLKLMANSILNKVGSKSIGWGNQAGIIVILYQVLDIFWNRIADTDSSPESGVACGTLSGLLYSIRGSPKKMLIGATLGTIGGLAYSVYTRRLDLHGTLAYTYRNTLDYFDTNPDDSTKDKL